MKIINFYNEKSKKTIGINFARVLFYEVLECRVCDCSDDMDCNCDLGSCIDFILEKGLWDDSNEELKIRLVFMHKTQQVYNHLRGLLWDINSVSDFDYIVIKASSNAQKSIMKGM